MNKAIIVGSGIAGLAAALRLRAKGYDVHIYEANETPGGKLTSITQGDYRWDFGPSLLTMPHLIDELFRLHGKQPKEYFSYTKNKTLCHYFWEDKTVFKADADTHKFVNHAAKTFKEDPQRIKDYLQLSKNKYNWVGKIFLYKDLRKLSTWINKDVLHALKKWFSLDLFSSLHTVNSRWFANPKLVQLFDRYATYNGSSPYETSGIMSMIPYLEMSEGSYFPDRGMVSISQSLIQLAMDVGIHFHLNTRVDTIEHEDGEVTGIAAKNTFVAADIVVCNMDIYHAYPELLSDVFQPKKTLELEKSSSAVVFYWGIHKRFHQLDLHNIFFSDDYCNEFKRIFYQKKLSDDPTVYLHISSKKNYHDAPQGCENWFVMVNAPQENQQQWDTEIAKLKEQVLSKLERILDESIRPYIQEEMVVTPKEIGSLTLSHKGALYGPSSNTRQAAFIRHANKQPDISRLYFCGGSVHPGGGLPLCLSSAKLACQDIPPSDDLELDKPRWVKIPPIGTIPIRYFAYALLWFIHGSGIWAIHRGLANDIIPMTFLVLLFTFYLVYEINLKYQPKKLYFFFLCLLTGYTAEWLGVHYGLIFGSYSYGANLGIKLSGVPITIAINWGILILCAGSIVQHIVRHPIFRALLGCILLLTLDSIMEQVSSPLDFWTFDTPDLKAGMQNYMGWFSLSFILLLILQYFRAYIRLSTAVNIYSVQFLFFLFIYFWFA